MFLVNVHRYFFNWVETTTQYVLISRNHWNLGFFVKVVFSRYPRLGLELLSLDSFLGDLTGISAWGTHHVFNAGNAVEE